MNELEKVEGKPHAVAEHWSQGGDMAQSINMMLDDSGVDGVGALEDKLKLIAEIDHFHGGSLETTEIVRRNMAISNVPNQVGLDIGGGVGGPMRWFALKTGAKMHEVDITPVFVDISNGITNRLGMKDVCNAQLGDATDLEFPEDTFDFATMMAVSPNITDRQKLYRSIAKVLKPGGLIGMLDLTQGPNPIIFPTPWSRDGSPTTSKMLTNEQTVEEARKAGLSLAASQDVSGEVLQWFENEQKELAAGRSIGREKYLPDYKEMVDNQIRNLREDRLKFECLVFRKNV